MRQILFLILTCILLTWTSPALCTDMRKASVEAEKIKASMVKKAMQEKKDAENEAQKARTRILNDKTKIKAASASLEKQNRETDIRIKNLEKQILDARTAKEKLIDELSKIHAQTRELVGFVRISAKDTIALINQSQQSAFIANRVKNLHGPANQAQFPSMDQINSMADILFDEIALSGQVRVLRGRMVDRAGAEVEADILVLGNFSAAYHKDDETGFLLYSDKSQRFFALSKKPAAQISSKIRDYMAGKSIDTPIDISKGGALRQMVQSHSLVEQVPKGGPIVWIIIILGVLALIIIVERIIFLLRMSINPALIMDSINSHAKDKNWDKCLAICEKAGNKPVPKVLAWGLKHQNLGRQDMENALQEAILGEIPRLERFLSALGMMAAVSPLLGLLGTVTGMINTFQIITYHGAGDPKMMSGGISEALVTTMMGLAVAIPILLAHTLLSRRAENIIAQMEEKAVSLVNTVFASKKR